MEYFMQLRPETGAIEAIGTGKFDGVVASIKLAAEANAATILRALDAQFVAAVSAFRRA